MISVHRHSSHRHTLPRNGTVSFRPRSPCAWLPRIRWRKPSIEDQAYFEETLHKIIQTRERVKLRLTELGFTFRDSRSNFIFASHKSCPAEELFEKLKEKDIYVRYFNKPRIHNYLRITIGTDAEMDEFLSEVENYLKESGRL